jgi:hypothetical protein
MARLKVSPGFSFPEDAVTSTILTYGGKGMGKSNSGAVFLEELSKNGLRWSALDPMGVLWGLRYSADGRGSGIECLILGGPHGDIPIEPTGGTVVADLVVNESVNVIIDFSRKRSGEMWGVGERVRFVNDYGKRLYQLQGSLIDGKRHEPIFQLIDEAARFMPQTIRQGEVDAAKCLSTWATIVEEGRNVGIGVGLLTQRSARLNKDVAELADVMIAFRTVGPNSVAAVMDWLGEHAPKEKIKGYVEQLRSLPRGTALVVSPGWLQIEAVVPMRARETFDSSSTPKPGEHGRKVSGRGAAPDLAKYTERMKETIERAREDDPKALKQTVIQLRHELAQEKTRKVVPTAAAAVPTPTRADPQEIAKIRAELLAEAQGFLDQRKEEVRRRLNDATSEIMNSAAWVLPKPSQRVEAALATLKSVPAPVSSANRRAPIPAPHTHSDTRTNSLPKPALPAGDRDGLSASQSAILQAIGNGIAIGRPVLTRTWAAFLAGVSPKSSGFEKNLSTLRTRGFIDYGAGSTLFLTEEGRKLVPVTQAVNEDGLHRQIASMLSSSQANIMRELLAQRGEPMTREELAEACNVSAKSSGFEKNLSSLRSLKLIDYGPQSTVFAVDDLFLTPAERKLP